MAYFYFDYIRPIHEEGDKAKLAPFINGLRFCTSDRLIGYSVIESHQEEGALRRGSQRIISPPPSIPTNYTQGVKFLDLAKHVSPIIVGLNGKHPDLSIPPGNTNEPITSDLTCRKKRDSNPIAVSVINREDGVLPRPTTFYNDQTIEHSDGEAKLLLRTRLSLASKVNVENVSSSKLH
ncbi:unnamed protein product [Rodentolepis nana]|uniref:Uncharacterized protein n=1 Tax=Rodentolepis nana TaxID=102285 RepID=A0A0R3T8G2_RODNA|nr:unnamed protein product [Rodentolepis nana]